MLPTGPAMRMVASGGALWGAPHGASVVARALQSHNALGGRGRGRGDERERNRTALESCERRRAESCTTPPSWPNMLQPSGTVREDETDGKRVCACEHVHVCVRERGGSESEACERVCVREREGGRERERE